MRRGVLTLELTHPTQPQTWATIYQKMAKQSWTPHAAIKRPPLWLTLYGLPGSGKSTLIQNIKSSALMADRDFHVIGENLLPDNRVNDLLDNMCKESYTYQLDIYENYAKQLDTIPTPKENLVVIEHIPLEMIHHFTFTHIYGTHTMSAHAEKRMNVIEETIKKKRDFLTKKFTVIPVTLACPFETAMTNMKRRDPLIYSRRGRKGASSFRALLQSVYLFIENRAWQTTVFRYVDGYDQSLDVIGLMLRREHQVETDLNSYMDSLMRYRQIFLDPPQVQTTTNNVVSNNDEDTMEAEQHEVESGYQSAQTQE